MTAPPEARCDGCVQFRPLFLYRPAHSVHVSPELMAACRWCAREKPLLLCARCWGAERVREENDPGLLREAKTWEQICAANRAATGEAGQ